MSAERIAALEHEAGALRRELARLRERFLALADTLPPGELNELVNPGGGPARRPAGLDLFTGWEETTRLTESDVATEMRLLWLRSPRAS